MCPLQGSRLHLQSEHRHLQLQQAQDVGLGNLDDHQRFPVDVDALLGIILHFLEEKALYLLSNTELVVECPTYPLTYCVRMAWPDIFYYPAASRKCQNPPTEVSGPCTRDAWWWAMQGVRTVYSTTWEEKTRKATNPVSQIHSTPFGRHRQHDWPGQAVWIGTGSLWLEEARSRVLCSRPMMMMMNAPLSHLFVEDRWPYGHYILFVGHFYSKKFLHLQINWNIIEIWTKRGKLKMSWIWNSSSLWMWTFYAQLLTVVVSSKAYN